MSDIRIEMLHLIRRSGSKTSFELADELKITASAIRQQLTILESEELIEARRETGRPGRPLHRYFLTDKAEKFFEKSYAGLSLELVEELVEERGLDTYLKKRQEKLVKKHKEATKGCKSIKEKLEVIAYVQEKAGYMASSSENELKEYNCPFIEVAKKHPEFCEAERLAYEKVLGKPVKLDVCRARGAQVCRFCVTEK